VIELLQIFLVAMESVNSLVMPDYLSDANSVAEINSPMLNIDTSSTPKKRKTFSRDVSIPFFDSFFLKSILQSFSLLHKATITWRKIVLCSS
jgi:hypothetical protein